jgi:hypothetical protein
MKKSNRGSNPFLLPGQARNDELFKVALITCAAKFLELLRDSWCLIIIIAAAYGDAAAFASICRGGGKAATFLDRLHPFSYPGSR